MKRLLLAQHSRSSIQRRSPAKTDAAPTDAVRAAAPATSSSHAQLDPPVSSLYASQSPIKMCCDDGLNPPSAGASESKPNGDGFVASSFSSLDALRESEARFKSMADGSPIMLWVTNGKGEIQVVNRAYCTFFGVTELQAHTPDSWKSFIHPLDQAHYMEMEAFFRTLAAPTPWVCRARVRRADGSWRWIETRSGPRFSDSGEFLGAACCSPDITEQVEAEQLLREADVNKDRFLSILAHELRSPLATMRTAATIVERQTSQMTRLVDDLLDVGRLGQRQIEPAARTCRSRARRQLS